jgi:tight adherence protein C
MLIYVTASLIFLSILFVSLSVLVYARDRMNPATQRLLRLSQPNRDILIDRATRQQEEPEEGVSRLEMITDRLSVLLTSLTAENPDGISPEDRIRFSKAGIRGEQQIRLWLGIRSILTAAVPALYVIFAIVAGHNFTTFLLMLILSFLLGRTLFRMLISNRIKKRNQMIGKNVHDAIDLLTVCLEAGLGLNIALQKVGENLRYINIALAEEFLLLNHEIQAGSTRVEAYRNMRNRTDVRELRSLLTMLIQSETLGTSLGQVLRTYSDTLRTKIRQKAEEQATKAGVKLAIPLVLFIFPPLFVVILGPALLQVVKLMKGFMQ